jgi:hypothetical protein
MEHSSFTNIKSGPETLKLKKSSALTGQLCIPRILKICMLKEEGKALDVEIR